MIPIARRRLVTKRTALVLYVVLLVLPTAVLCGLHWHQLVVQHRLDLALGPERTQDAARRLKESIAQRLEELVRREDARDVFEYRHAYFPRGTVGADLVFVPSPLAVGPAPDGVLGWFQYDFAEGEDAEPTMLFGGRASNPEFRERAERLEGAARDLVRRDYNDSFLARITRLRDLDVVYMPLSIAAVNHSSETDLACLREHLSALQGFEDEYVAVQVFGFHLRFYREADGTPRILARRQILIESDQRLQSMPPCFDSLGYGATIVQGFFIDPEWLFGAVPAAEASRVLSRSHTFVPAGADFAAQPQGDWDVATIPLVEELGFETYDEADAAWMPLRIAFNTRSLDERFRAQSRRFLGVVAMLTMALGTGLWLLLGSVRRDLEQARRTQNFVAAVTHELRTPLSAIKLYGEMLLEGWVEDPARREEYYRRIVRETGRLETLVERVLEKSRLSSEQVEPTPGDLNRHVEALVPVLAQVSEHGGRDLRLDLAAGLPHVLLIPEAVRSIVINLVENARKYAAVDPDAPGAEPLLVTTRALGGEVALEVADRGPGIPLAERSHVFDAFYRVGHEATRTAAGTGLGLHLVALQARAMGGRVQVLDREGGGTVFRVTFRRAPEEDALPEPVGELA